MHNLVLMLIEIISDPMVLEGEEWNDLGEMNEEDYRLQYGDDDEWEDV